MTSRNALLVLLVLTALAILVGIGYVASRRVLVLRQLPPTPDAATTERVIDAFRKAAQEAGTQTAARRQSCIREKLGAERYAAIVLQPSSVQAEDQLKILPCYE